MEFGGIEPERSRFKASIVKAGTGSCGLRVIGASSVGNPSQGSCLIEEGVLLDKLSRGTSEAVARYRQAQRMVASVVIKAKQWL